MFDSNKFTWNGTRFQQVGSTMPQSQKIDLNLQPPAQHNLKMVQQITFPLYDDINANNASKIKTNLVEVPTVPEQNMAWKCCAEKVTVFLVILILIFILSVTMLILFLYKSTAETVSKNQEMFTTTTISPTTTTSTTTTTSSTSFTSTTTTTSTTPLPCSNMKWNTTGITIAGTGVVGSGLNQLWSPGKIFLDSAKNLYIADLSNQRIMKYTFGATNGTIVAGITGVNGSAANQLSKPSSVFVDEFQNVYVADRLNNRIQFFSNGTTNGVTVTNGWGVGNIWSLFVLSPGLIYAGDLTNSTIWLNGTVFAGGNGPGPNSNQLFQPQGFTVDTQNNIGTAYIANSAGHTVVQWLPGASSGTIVAGTNGVAGNTSVTMKFPVDVQLDSYNNLFVLDNNNHRVQLYCRYPTVNSSAITIVGTGISGNTATTLSYPTGLVLDNDRNLYVSDTGNNRVQMFRRLV